MEQELSKEEKDLIADLLQDPGYPTISQAKIAQGILTRWGIETKLVSCPYGGSIAVVTPRRLQDLQKQGTRITEIQGGKELSEQE